VQRFSEKIMRKQKVPLWIGKRKLNAGIASTAIGFSRP
jgi:hypothetical protein